MRICRDGRQEPHDWYSIVTVEKPEWMDDGWLVVMCIGFTTKSDFQEGTVMTFEINWEDLFDRLLTNLNKRMDRQTASAAPLPASPFLASPSPSDLVLPPFCIW